jgi:opacity protein-like surface antigen
MIKLIPKGKEGCRMRLQYVLLAAVLAVSGLSFSSQAAASPLKNYSAGRVAVSGGGTFPTSIEFDDFDTEGKKASVYGGVTAGLGGKTALNYRYDQYQTDHDDIQTNQLNLMYQVIPGLSVYGGYVHAKTDVHDWEESSNSAQVGLQGRIDIPLLFTIWGTAGYGSKLNTFEIGVSKPILNNLDVDVSYYSNRFKDLDQGGDADSHGVRAGLTFKF